MATYTPNIPQATDLPSQSQPLILGNFQSIQALIDVNHVDFANATNMGKHNFVSYVAQSSAPVLNNMTDVIGYGFVSPITSQNELYISKVNQTTVTLIASTASILSTTSAPANGASGWTYLPSGILLVWGTATVTSTSGSPAQAVLFPTAANIPVFNQLFSVQVTYYNTTASDTNGSVTLQNMSGTTGFSVVAAQRTTASTYITASFTYLAIGY